MLVSGRMFVCLETFDPRLHPSSLSSGSGSASQTSPTVSKVSVYIYIVSQVRTGEDR